jgi:hypothetical protein
MDSCGLACFSLIFRIISLFSKGTKGPISGGIKKPYTTGCGSQAFLGNFLVNFFHAQIPFNLNSLGKFFDSARKKF